MKPHQLDTEARSRIAPVAIAVLALLAAFAACALYSLIMAVVVK